MLKAPRLGTVKTRLAKDLGDAAALAAYRELVEHQFRAIPAGWQVEVHFTPDDGAGEMRAWLAPLRKESVQFHPQTAGDLGQRLAAALDAAWQRGSRCIIFVGGDCPELHAGRLCEIADRLEAADVVVVPARDGGYVSIAFREPHTGLFDRIAWSTEVVCKQTEQRARELGLRVALLNTLEDVDDLSSWERARAILGDPGAHPGG